MLVLSALLAAMIAAGARAAPGDATATLVANIAPGGADFFPTQLTNVNGTVFFRANDGANGQELWKTDGTLGGTTMVEDAVPGGGINPGAASSAPTGLTAVNGTLYFTANDGTNGVELWKSDGTPAGTKMVDVFGGGINPGPASSNPIRFTNVNGTVFFTATDGTNGVEIWKTDGTPAGTAMVEDTIPGGGGIRPGPADSSPFGLVNVNGTLLFHADDGTNGREVWRSDGSPVGTSMVEDAVPGGGIRPGANVGSDPFDLTDVNGTLYFTAEDGTNGNELWKSASPFATATMVEDALPGGGINPGAASSGPQEPTNVNGTVYFAANDGTNGLEVWRSDGTPAGTTIVEDAIPSGGIRPGATGSNPGHFANLNGIVLFSADDGTNGNELWRSDGTPAGTTIVEDAVPGGGIRPGATGSTPQSFANVNGTLFLEANDGTNGNELWRSVSPYTTVTMVEDAVPGGGINPGGASSNPFNYTDLNGTVLFGADDGPNGIELWKLTIEGPATPPPAVNPGPTGQRAAALKKCKKKRGRARANCKKKAKKLPL